jgi:hypothetical protein
LGRLISGVGSGALGLGVIYFTTLTGVENRLHAVGGFRASQVRTCIHVVVLFGLSQLSLVCR